MSRLVSYKGLGEPTFGGNLNNLTTATTALAQDSSGNFLVPGVLNVWNGNAGPARLFLPQAEAGLVVDILLTIDAVSSATLIGPSTGNSGTQDIFTIQGSETTGGFIQCQTTAEGGTWIRCVGLTQNHWMGIAMGSSVGFVSTSTGA